MTTPSDATSGALSLVGEHAKRKTIIHANKDQDGKHLIVPLAISAVDGAKPGSGQRKARGLNVKITFEHNGVEFKLAGWLGLTAR